jgi:peptide/nickel transport system permease protein
MFLLNAWRSSGKFRLGAALLVLLCAIALLHPLEVRLLIGDTDPLATGTFDIFDDPSIAHPFGTDRYGRDVVALVLIGLLNSLEVGLLAGAISTILGVMVGFIAGYKGGGVDGTLRTVTDMFLVIPTLPLLITLSAYVRSLSLPVLGLILASFSWPFAARAIRTQVLSLRSRPYVELARMSVMSDAEIIVQELLPNLVGYIALGFAGAALGAIGALVGLEVIGLGPSNTMDLGLLINLAQQWGVLSLGKWTVFTAPVLALVSLFVAMVLINIGLEETFNPRLRGVTGR